MYLLLLTFLYFTSAGCWALWTCYIDAKEDRELFEKEVEDIGAELENMKRQETTFLVFAIVWTIFTVSCEI